MKPKCPSPLQRSFAAVDYFFNAGLGEWRGYSSSSDGGDAKLRGFHNLSRDFLVEAARERAQEMALFGLILAVSVWPVIYMVITVINLLIKKQVL